MQGCWVITLHSTCTCFTCTWGKISSRIAVAGMVCVCMVCVGMAVQGCWVISLYLKLHLYLLHLQPGKGQYCCCCCLQVLLCKNVGSSAGARGVLLLLYSYPTSTASMAALSSGCHRQQYAQTEQLVALLLLYSYCTCTCCRLAKASRGSSGFVKVKAVQRYRFGPWIYKIADAGDVLCLTSMLQLLCARV